MHCDEDELDLDKEKGACVEQSDTTYSQIPALGIDTLEDPKTPLPQTPRTPMAFQTAHGNQADSRNPTNAPTTPSPLSRRESALDTNGLRDAFSPEALKARVMEAYEKQNVDSDDASSDMLDLDPNTEYARIKLRMLERARVSETAELTVGDKMRLKELREHYFFKEKEAEAAFRQLKSNALAAAKDARLRDPNASPLSTLSLLSAPKITSRKERPPSLLSPAASPKFGSPKKQSSDVADDSTSEVSGEGGMFGNMLDETPTSEVVAGANGNTTVRIRDMSLPKQWGGRTPKILLTETVHKIDRYAAVSYFPIPITSRAVRSGVNIRWGGAGRQKQLPQEWRMEEDGCHDHAQSEQFIATIAFHALTFTSPPGFASPSNSGGGAQTHFRMLPPVYRDLWDELETKRKDAEDATNRSIWRRLKGIAVPRIGATLKVM